MPAPDASGWLVTSAWRDGTDPLFGAYKERNVSGRGACFACGARIDGSALQRMRGGSTWELCLPQPCQRPKPKKKGSS